MNWLDIFLVSTLAIEIILVIALIILNIKKHIDNLKFEIRLLKINKEMIESDLEEKNEVFKKVMEYIKELENER